MFKVYETQTNKENYFKLFCSIKVKYTEMQTTLEIVNIVNTADRLRGLRSKPSGLCKAVYCSQYCDPFCRSLCRS